MKLQIIERRKLLENKNMKYDIKKKLNDLENKNASYWEKKGEAFALKCFKETSTNVPAYSDFLKTKKIKPSSITTIAKFRDIPSVDKQSYLKKYKRDLLVPGGKFDAISWVISSTSGSTGEPYYFPRTREQDLQYAHTAELYLRANFQIEKKSTLYINAFAMGVWIGGLFTYQAISLVADTGKYKLSIVNPGLNKPEILKTIKNLGGEFDQVIVGGYPPFIKDVIDLGIEEKGFDWKKFNLKFIFSAEGFNEDFRNYIIENTGLKNPYTDTLNHYGTVDLGTMSYETPISILIRRLALENETLFAEIFGDTYRLPTLTQFLPDQFYFESVNSKLYCTAKSGIPLIRYDLKDSGEVISFESMKAKLKKHGFDIEELSKQNGISKTLWKIPFVFVNERADFTVSFRGANIYPQTIRTALQHKTLEESTTGKFTMKVNYNKKQDQYLEINVELKPNASKNKTLLSQIKQFVITSLNRENSEFRSQYEDNSKIMTPKIVLWPFNDNLYFSGKGKQKWVQI